MECTISRIFYNIAKICAMFKITPDLSYLITALISRLLLVSCLCNKVYNYIDIYYTYSKTIFLLS